MIDFNDMKGAQVEGVQLIDSLDEDERAVLQHYCSLCTEALQKLGEQKKSTPDQVIINALKNGIGLGLKLKIANGEVHRRP